MEAEFLNEDGLEPAVAPETQPPNPPTEPLDPTTPIENAASATIATPLAEKCKADAQIGFPERCQEGSPEGFMKNSRFWLADGNTQVQIGPIRFNLHRSRLAASSLWFKRYFEEQDAREIESGFEMVNELEVVELDATGIDITDFERLLSAMDDIVDYYHSPPPFATLASIFRAASILEFPKFQSYAGDALEALFPDSLEDVRAKPTPYAAEAIVLARAWNLPRVLKRAFYELARSPPGAATASALSLLSPADIILVAQAKNHLAAAWLSAYAPPKFGCNRCACESFIAVSRKFADMCWFMSLTGRYQFDPVFGLAMLPREYAKQDDCCSICAETREKGWKTHASRIWNTDLNVWFGLGPVHPNKN
ncbi:hypothetical protein BD779DRAFT_132607 [Infundibulicybe gibba]|nr:hypothetical protein BD779DRAFT_132607 [Infundibulicybe gibba]